MRSERRWPRRRKKAESPPPARAALGGARRRALPAPAGLPGAGARRRIEPVTGECGGAVRGEGIRSPLRISLEAGELLLSGRMDLLERNDAGEYRVVDFKTRGSKSSIPAKGKILDGGESLQLHLYARGLRSRKDALPEDARVSGAYVYVTEEEGVEERVRSLRGGRGAHGGRGCAFGLFPRLGRGGAFFPDAHRCRVPVLRLQDALRARQGPNAPREKRGRGK